MQESEQHVCSWWDGNGLLRFFAFPPPPPPPIDPSSRPDPQGATLLFFIDQRHPPPPPSLPRQVRDDKCENDNIELRTKALHSMLVRLMYNRRNKFNPLYNYLIVGGFADDGVTPYLGYVDNIGTSYEDNFVTTGFGSHLALPILRKHWKEGMTRDEARALLTDCLRVLYYRDCRTMNRIRVAYAEMPAAGEAGAAGAAAAAAATAAAAAPGGAGPTMVIEAPVVMETKWDYKAFVAPKAGADTDGSW